MLHPHDLRRGKPNFEISVHLLLDSTRLLSSQRHHHTHLSTPHLATRITTGEFVASTKTTYQIPLKKNLENAFESENIISLSHCPNHFPLPPFPLLSHHFQSCGSFQQYPSPDLRVETKVLPLSPLLANGNDFYSPGTLSHWYLETPFYEQIDNLVVTSA